ncbi:MAG: hypothetical protein V4714_02855 [Bacteroidota bacterium]
MNKLSVVTCIFISCLLQGCSFFRNEYPAPQYNRGVVILQTSTIDNKSYLSYLDTIGNSVTQNIFMMQNKAALGKGANALSFYNGRGYIMLTQEDEITVINAITLEKTGTIRGQLENNLAQCRYFAAINASKAYVTCWGNTSTPSSVAVIDLNTLEVIKNINLGSANKPEAIIIKPNYAYVALSEGKSIVVIDTDKDQVTTSISVHEFPAQMVIDQSENIWVLHKDTVKILTKINSLTTATAIDIHFSETTTQLGNLSINQTGDVLYFSTNTPTKTKLDSIYRFPITDTQFNHKKKNGIVQQLVEKMKIDPNNNMLYASNRKQGYIIRYKLPAANITGAVSKTDSLSVIATPVDFTFQPKIQ